MKRLFRVFAHIYHSHAHEIAALELEEELNTSFMRFMEYVPVVVHISKLLQILRISSLVRLTNEHLHEIRVAQFCRTVQTRKTAGICPS